MARPVLTFEIAFNAGYATPAASRTWTAVTEYVLSVAGAGINVGRSDELSTAGPNQCSLTLDNSDGRFTAGLSTSPYYPNVKIGRPIRVTATQVGNLVPNPSFEVNTTGWSATDGASLARVTTQFDQGVASMSVTGAGALAGAVTSTGVSGFAVTAGQTYTAQARSKAATVARSFSVSLAWYTAAGGLISTSTGGLLTDSTSAWTSNTVTAAAPATAAFAAVWVRWLSAAAEVHWLDSVMVEQAASAATYGDGSKAGWRWSGTAHQSSSLRAWERFNGYVDEWPLEWPAVVGTIATARLQATSRLARIALGVELRSIIEEEILLDGPVQYCTLGEPEGSTQANDSSGNAAAPLLMTGTGAAVVFGTATGPGTDGLTAATFANGKALRASNASQTSWTLEFFLVTSTASQTIASLYQGGGPLLVSAAGKVDDGAALGLTSTTTVTDGAVHHVALTCDGAATTTRLYVDGVEEDSASGVAFLFQALAYVGGDASNGFTGTLAHWALHDSALSAARIAAHADAGLTGFEGETPAGRLARYAAFAGVPAGETSFETGDLPDLAHIDTTGKTALACMREVETTEDGVLFDAPDGTLTFHDRAHRYAATPVITLDVNAGELHPDYAPKLDTFGLLNDVTATGSTGITARVVDQSSIDDNGSYRESIDLATSNPDEPLQAAAWRVGNYAEPATRAPVLVVELATLSAVRQAAVLAAGVGDLITVSNLMTQSDTSSKRFFVEGYAETLGDSTHQIAFNLSPAAISDVWILDDATYSVLGTTTRLGY